MTTRIHPQLERMVYQPSPQRLRALAQQEEITTEFGSPAYVSRVRSRSAKFTKNNVDEEFSDEEARALHRALDHVRDHEMIVLDRWLGQAPPMRRCCRLILSAAYARIALGWGELLEPADEDVEPDYTTVYLPEWEATRVLVDPDQRATFVLGTDYIGEAKKSFLRMWMYDVKRHGGLGLHAGSKRVRVRTDAGVREVVQLFFGLSATGKTTLTTQTLGLEDGEAAELIQDDVVAWMPDGRCLGSEGKGLYIKTDGLSPESQPELYRAVTQPSAVLENVWVDRQTGRVDFFNTELTSNGRATVQRAALPHAAAQIDASRVDQLFFITRTPLVPPLARLSPAQAAVAFMLGESVESSAGDPTRAGQRVRVVGTNPFIIGPPAEEGNRLFELLQAHPHVECFLVNTGHAGEGPRARKITVEVTVHLLRALARGQIRWQRDEQYGFDLPADVPGLDLEAYDPRRAYSAEAFRDKLAELRRERDRWLKRFPGLNQEVLDAVY